MFREMRRKKQQLPQEECVRILEECTSGVLALLGDEDYPYAVPLSYVYEDGKLWFHGAMTGHKLDAMRKHDKASFCVVAQDQVVAEEYTTYFRSVIAFGRMRELEGEEKWRAIDKLAARYHPTDSAENRQKAIGRETVGLCMMELAIEHMTGKEAMELTRQRKAEG